jgi:DNA-binding response OmpR family regulator
MAVNILLIDDDLLTAQDVQPALAREGFHVRHVLPGRAALRQVLIEEPDLVVLGVVAHDDGWRFCRRLLVFLDQPLLLLLSTGDPLDRARALDMGADDCMIKPPEMVEFLARVRALLRREVPESLRARQSFFVDGDLMIDLTRHEVRVHDEPVRLTPNEFRILTCLVQHEGEVLAHDHLRTEVWGPGYDGSRDAIKQYIHHLRLKLEPNPNQPRRIVTRWGVGYMLTRIGAEG